ncbi:hypothetical protein OIN60_03155 [Paenibacillus sp. P96]|uniref:Phage protein n=1 Tax=Paenibacillus zeirhizosphaerae TaxID=2987519 RepID=A0ABT9FN02_9BACL|nr:hypothetical protein [Paenibacillus sp. P96]MDP4095787.1 hypothetical protein [Paenibacillus sp. P96]
MKHPTWFERVMQHRLDDVSARIIRQPEISTLREEEHLVFQRLFSGMDLANKPEFSDWEDKHHHKQALENEYLYWQGMKDGVQLAYTVLEMMLHDEKEQEE